jgi:hypothetical protein
LGCHVSDRGRFDSFKTPAHEFGNRAEVNPAITSLLAKVLRLQCHE